MASKQQKKNGKKEKKPTKAQPKKGPKKGSARKKSYVVFVLDESSSMLSMAKEAVGAFNQHVKDVRENSKKNNIKSSVSFLKFSSEVHTPTYWNVPVDNLTELSEKDYTPNGMTAMLDAVGYAIDKLNEEKDVLSGKAAVLVVVVSDGEENNSKRFSYHSIAEKIKELNLRGNWTFTYSGANQDLSVLSQRLNIPLGNMQKFVADAQGVRNASLSRSVSTQDFFTSYAHSAPGASFNVNGFYENENKTDPKDSSTP